jgi:hypothetical protein
VNPWTFRGDWLELSKAERMDILDAALSPL